MDAEPTPVETAPVTPVTTEAPAAVVTVVDPAPPPAETPPPAKSWYQEIFDAEGNFVEKWQEKLPSELENEKSVAAQYKNLPSLLKSLKENMGYARSKGNVKPLTETSTPEEIADYRTKMGIPAEPYNFEKPETLPEGVEWKEDRVKQFGEWAQSKNLTPAQAKDAFDLHLKFLSEDFSSHSAAQAERMNQALAEEKRQLQLTFGGNLDTTIVAAQRAALSLNIPTQALDPNSPSFLGVSMLGVFAKIAELQGESRLPTVAAVTNMSPGRQAADIQTNPGNPEHALFLKGDSRVVAKVVELNRLHVANGGR